MRQRVYSKLFTERLPLAGVIVFVLSCGGESTISPPATSTIWSLMHANAKLASSSGTDKLYPGQSLTLVSEAASPMVQADSTYRTTVTLVTAAEAEAEEVCCGSGSSFWYSAYLYTGSETKLPDVEVFADIGEDGRDMPILPGDFMRVEFDNGEYMFKAYQGLRLAKGEPGEPPHIYASDDARVRTNAFVVGSPANAPKYPDAEAGPVYVAGMNLPANTTMDVYVVVDGDDWAGKPIPQTGEPNHRSGPIAVTTNASGRLLPTLTGFTPDETSLGNYDLIVDVDRDGIFDWTDTEKDGVDGMKRAGFTVQYAPDWSGLATRRHLLANIAYQTSTKRFTSDFGAEWVHAKVVPPVHLPRPFPVPFRPEQLSTGIVVVVPHQDFATFWNSDDAALDAGCKGCRDLSKLAVQVGDTHAAYVMPLRRGSMASEPLPLVDGRLLPKDSAGQPIKCFDVVFLPHQNDRAKLVYVPGVSVLDVYDGSKTGLIEASDINKASCGFRFQ